VAFLKTLADDRERMASFDIPNGSRIPRLLDMPVMDDRTELPAVDADGHGVGLGMLAATITPLGNFPQP
jgi:hypothetical protein